MTMPLYTEYNTTNTNSMTTICLVAQENLADLFRLQTCLNWPLKYEMYMKCLQMPN